LNLRPIDKFSVPNENLKDRIRRSNEHSSERAETRSPYTAQKRMRTRKFVPSLAPAIAPAPAPIAAPIHASLPGWGWVNLRIFPDLPAGNGERNSPKRPGHMDRANQLIFVRALNNAKICTTLVF